MKEIKLSHIQTKSFDDFLFIGFDKKWLSINDDKPLDFDTKIIEGQLILSAKLARLERTKEVSKNEM